MHVSSDTEALAAAAPQAQRLADLDSSVLRPGHAIGASNDARKACGFLSWTAVEARQSRSGYFPGIKESRAGSSAVSAGPGRSMGVPPRRLSVHSAVDWEPRVAALETSGSPR
ncbi:hypothetical protein VTN00DRAFT_7213 [Thermoascus crustaceus]|uniref:uncharacterized protein n=1 Tax=Thermoascus crustaceus TaxID=5088 RepID=UPI0037441AE9